MNREIQFALIVIGSVLFGILLCRAKPSEQTMPTVPTLHTPAEISAVVEGMSAERVREILGAPWGSKGMPEGATALYFDGEDAEGIDRVVEVIIVKGRVAAVSVLK